MLVFNLEHGSIHSSIQELC